MLGGDRLNRLAEKKTCQLFESYLYGENVKLRNRKATLTFIYYVDVLCIGINGKLQTSHRTEQHARRESSVASTNSKLYSCHFHQVFPYCEEGSRNTTMMYFVAHNHFIYFELFSIFLVFVLNLKPRFLDCLSSRQSLL